MHKSKSGKYNHTLKHRKYVPLNNSYFKIIYFKRQLGKLIHKFNCDN